MKKISYRRRPQNIECEIAQQPLGGYYPNFELKLRVPNQTLQKRQMKMISYGRQPQNIERAISQQPLAGFTQILNLSLWYQTKLNEYDDLQWKTASKY